MASGRKKRKMEQRKGTASLLYLPAQQELFLDPEKQRSRIAFHPPLHHLQHRFTSKCGIRRQSAPLCSYV